MTTYILLRKNKESGPFRLDDLRTMVILPDDLFWIEGQSVCWLNPGEIKELRELVGIPARQTENMLSAYMPPEPETLYGVKSPPTGTKTGHTPYLNTESAFAGTLEVPVEKDPEEPELHYEKPLHEIKAIYLKNLELQRNRKRLPVFLPPAVKKAMPFAAFLLIGLLAGILISKKGSRNSTVRNAVSTEKGTQPVKPLPANSFAEQTGPPVLPSADTAITVIETEEPLPDEPLPDPVPVAARKTVVKKPVVAEPEPEKKASVSATDEREARSRETGRVPDPVAPPDLFSMVTVTTNDYQVGSFGGIRNLQLTLKNASDYPLRQVTAELRYYKPGDELLKTENHYFYSVAARGMQVIAVPKSARGVKVTCRLVRIDPMP